MNKYPKLTEYGIANPSVPLGTPGIKSSLRVFLIFTEYMKVREMMMSLSEKELMWVKSEMNRLNLQLP